jgi:hypothetical protein
MKNHSSKHVLHKLHIDQTSHSLTSLKSAGNHHSRKTFLMVMLQFKTPLGEPNMDETVAALCTHETFQYLKPTNT